MRGNNKQDKSRHISLQYFVEMKLKTHEQKLHTTEMRMLRLYKDKVHNDHIRGSFGVTPIIEKLSESWWYSTYKHIDRYF